MTRRAHYLRGNARSETVQRAIVFDTETDPIEIDEQTIGHKLAFGWAAYVYRGRDGAWSEPDWIRFDSIDTFWGWVEARTAPKTRTMMYCHNTSFDLPVLDAFRELPSRGWECDRLVIEAPPTIIRMRRDGRTLVLLDTLNWWRMPLRRLGDSLGIPKLDMPAQDAPREAWDRYGKRDVEILLAAVTRWTDWLRRYDLGGYALTLAGQSLRTYRHRFMSHKILLDDHDRALGCARECYHGGRTEAWRIGHYQQCLHLVDINSLYPHVMRKHAYPTALRYYSCLTTPSDLKRHLSKYLVCARVTVEVNDPALAVVRESRLVFPTGRFRAALTTPELRWVYRHGRVLAVHDMALYDSAPLFRAYVDTLYQWRLDARSEGRTVDADSIKLLMNSLYGKFGQRGYRYEIVEHTDDLGVKAWDEVRTDTRRTVHYRQAMGVILEQHTEAESADSHPAIAAHVCAHGRMLLWSLIETAGRDDVWYMDTDSLLVTDSGLERLRPHIDETRLGALKHEGSYDDVEIWGAKDYRFGISKKIKGIRADAVQLGEDRYEQDRWSGLRGLLRCGDIVTPTTRRIVKRLSRDYRKGVVGPDGVVSPLALDED